MYIVKEIVANRHMYMNSFLQLTDSKPCIMPPFPHVPVPQRTVQQAMYCPDSCSSAICTISSCSHPWTCTLNIHLYKHKLGVQMIRG